MGTEKMKACPDVSASEQAQETRRQSASNISNMQNNMDFWILQAANVGNLSFAMIEACFRHA